MGNCPIGKPVQIGIDVAERGKDVAVVSLRDQQGNYYPQPVWWDALKWMKVAEECHNWFRIQYMQEPPTTLAEILIPKRGEHIGVLAHGYRHYDYFVRKICDAAKSKKVAAHFAYIDNLERLRCRGKVIRLDGWWRNYKVAEADQIDEYIIGRNIEAIDVDDRKLDQIIN